MDKVRETLLKMWNAIRERWLAIGKSVRIIVLSVVGAVVVAIIVLSTIMNRTGYTPLYTTDITSAEITEIATILRDELLITDYHVTNNQIMISDSLINSVRMEMAVRGYPKSNWNNDIWDTGVGMFSTEREMNVKERQQLAAYLMAALDTLNFVNYSRVIISPTTTQTYVIAENKQDVKVSVVLVLKEGERLKAKQIEGVYHIVETAIAGLSRDNISIVDDNGILLVADDAPSGAETLSLEMQKYNIQYDFKRVMETQLKEDISVFLASAYRDFSVNATIELDYGTEITESTEYHGSNVDADGFESGIVSESTKKAAAGGTAAEGGVIGTTTNADISPDAPTIEATAGQDMYYESLNETKYLVNEIKKQYQTGPFVIKKISLAVLIDDSAMTQEEIDRWRYVFAQAAGTSIDFVAVMPTTFPLKPNIQDSTNGLLPATNRNTLIFIIIALGALLIILFFLGIMTSGSKKKRQVKSRLAAATAAAGPMGKVGGNFDEDVFGSITASKVTGVEGRTEDFGIASLIADEGESRETVLKNEIREFARTNPDIVAQLIRTWMKE